MVMKLNINDNVVLNYEDLTYKSTIQDIQEDYYVINLPLGEGEYLTLEDGAEIELGIVKEGGYYILQSEIINRIMEDGKPFYRITIPTMKKKIERRDFVRISLLDYTFYKTEHTAWTKAMILDLSGGGMKLVIKEKVKLGDKLQIGLVLGNESFQLEGKVVRVVVNEMKENVCGIEFIHLTERIRDRIIAKIFIELRKQTTII